MGNRKPIEEADLMDDIFMQLIASDPDIGEGFCRTLLSVLLQLKIGEIKVHVQSVLPGSRLDIRGVRLDVEVKESTSDVPSRIVNVYDIEPHNGKEENLNRMLRFRQAKIDSRFMNKRDNDFSHLPNLYVIYITNNDPFGRNYMMYTVRNACVEIPEIQYEDGLTFLYFYTNGEKGGSDSIRNMLEYIQNSKEQSVVDDATREIDRYVQDARLDPEIRGNYMTIGDKIDQEKKISFEEGIEKGIEKGQTMLIDALTRLRNGTSFDDLIKEGYDEATVRKACDLK